VGKSDKEIDTIDRITAEEFSKVEIGESKVIDVRKDTEYSAEHVEEAFSKPLPVSMIGSKISILKNRFLALCRRIPV
jgi:rhodanese-related sulfurtransferase